MGRLAENHMCILVVFTRVSRVHTWNALRSDWYSWVCLMTFADFLCFGFGVSSGALLPVGLAMVPTMVDWKLSLKKHQPVVKCISVDFTGQWIALADRNYIWLVSGENGERLERRMLAPRDRHISLVEARSCCMSCGWCHFMAFQGNRSSAPRCV